MNPEMILDRMIPKDFDDNTKRSTFLNGYNLTEYIKMLFSDPKTYKIAIAEEDIPYSLGIQETAFTREYDSFAERCIRKKSIIAPSDKIATMQKGILRGMEYNHDHTLFIFTHVSRNKHLKDILVANITLERTHPYNEDFCFTPSEFYHFHDNGNQIRISNQDAFLKEARTEDLLDDVNSLFRQLAYIYLRKIQ